MKNLHAHLLMICIALFIGSCSKKTPTNFLFIAIDDMNDYVGVLGGHPQAITPNIDKLANQGILFTNAHTPAPACSPCRNAVLYGMEPHNSGLYPFYNRHEMNSSFFDDHKSLMELLRENGYNTYGAGKIHHGSMNPSTISMFDSLLLANEYVEVFVRKTAGSFPEPDIGVVQFRIKLLSLYEFV